LVPRTFFILFLRSLRCLRVAFCFSNSPCFKNTSNFSHSIASNIYHINQQLHNKLHPNT
jgi:hypothetical protein